MTTSAASNSDKVPTAREPGGWLGGYAPPEGVIGPFGVRASGVLGHCK